MTPAGKLTLTVKLTNAAYINVDGITVASFGYRKASDFDNTAFPEWNDEYGIDLTQNTVEFKIQDPAVTKTASFTDSSNE